MQNPPNSLILALDRAYLVVKMLVNLTMVTELCYDIPYALFRGQISTNLQGLIVDTHNPIWQLSC